MLVHSVHPASVVTDLASQMPAELVKGALLIPGTVQSDELLLTGNFSARAAVCNDTPELAGDSIVYLTSKRREWLAGRYVSCAWDMPELMGREHEIVERNLLKLQMNF